MSLSPQQKAVLELVANGLVMKNVADRMGIALCTAEIHARKARNALGAKTMPHAIAIAMRQGLLS